MKNQRMLDHFIKRYNLEVEFEGAEIVSITTLNQYSERVPMVNVSDGWQSIGNNWSLWLPIK